MGSCEEDAELCYPGDGYDGGVQPEENAESYGEPEAAGGDA